MKGVLVLSGLLAAACGSVDDRGDCSQHVDCPQGQYCAATADGSVCWGDATAPEVASVVATCTGGCRRDSVLHVAATISDATSDVLDATVALDLPGDPVALRRSGAGWVADVDLARFAFEHFARDVVATVTARDGARNASAGTAAAAVGVTRLRWTYDAGAPVTAPAVMPDGTVVVGVSSTSDQLLAVRPDGTKAWSTTVGGTSFVTAAPAIGEHAIWVGSEDFSLYAVELDGSAVKANVGVNLGGAIRGSIAVLPAGAKEWAFATASAGDGTGFVGVSSSAPGERNVTSAPAQEGFTAGAVLDGDGRVHGPTATGANLATLRSYTLSTAPVVLTPTWTASVGRRSSAPLSMDGAGSVLSASDDTPAALNRTLPGPTPTTTKIGDLAGTAGDSAIVLANGDVVVGDESGRVHRFTAAGAAWSPAPNLGAPVRGPMVLEGTNAPFIVPTNAGKVHALGPDGSVRWEGTLPSAVGLRAANLFTPPGQAAGAVTSTAYLASGNGRLYAVIVDGQLDASAPWPKAFHDPRNTNRAGPQP